MINDEIARKLTELEQRLRLLELTEISSIKLLSTPLTSTSWDGDAKTAADNATIDLSAVFGVPEGVRAVLVRFEIAATSANVFAGVGQDSTYYYIIGNRTQVANVRVSQTALVNCDANGNIYFFAGGNLSWTLIDIWGYVI